MIFKGLRDAVSFACGSLNVPFPLNAVPLTSHLPLPTMNVVANPLRSGVFLC